MKDLTGLRFSRLLVVARAPSRLHRGRNTLRWTCVCDCKAETVVDGNALRSGHTRSCGCLQRDYGRSRATHGQSSTKTYRVWQGMWARCTNPNNKHFDRYGGRGISICESWQSFENFFADMGECPPDKSIDRIDNDSGYEPGNCRWADEFQQARNRSSSIFIDINGVQLTVKEAADLCRIPAPTIYNRIRSGWPAERWLEPSATKFRRHVALPSPEEVS